MTSRNVSPRTKLRNAADILTAWCPNFKHAPLLGQDNYYVFHDLLGMADEEFARLVDERIIY